MATFLRRLSAVLLPFLLFVATVPLMRSWMMHGRVWQGIALMLAGVALLALVEGLLFRYWLLPKFSEAIGERIYAGDYVASEDALACAVQRVTETKDKALLSELESVVRAQSDRCRGWLELARLREDLAADPAAAVRTLEEGAMRTSGREDRALLLYRAAQQADKGLHDSARARALYTEAAEHYPKTVYGKLAAERLK